VKFDLADGSMYIVDFGELEMRKGKEFVKARTGKIFKLVPQAPPTTQPTTTAITGSKSPTYQQSSSLEAE
jgi:hypothetical protein